MLPQSHVVIAGLIYDDIQREHQVKLNKSQLVFGSVKPDIYSGIPKLKHFKPQSFDTICREISSLAATRIDANEAALGKLSQKIDIVTHYIADYFCIPHNDRKTYQHHIVNHLRYEMQLHKMFKDSDPVMMHKPSGAVPDLSHTEMVMNYLDHLHIVYESRPDSYLNDLASSINAARSVASLIVRHSITGSASHTLAA